jgi:hypothetical protein
MPIFLLILGKSPNIMLWSYNSQGLDGSEDNNLPTVCKHQSFILFHFQTSEK